MAAGYSICLGTAGWGVWHSPDAGQSWSRHRTPFPLNSRIQALVAHPTRARTVFRGRRPPDRLGLRCLELRDPVAADPLELCFEDARVGPFAVRAEADVAGDGCETVAAQVRGELALIEAVRGFHGLLQLLHPGVGKRRHVIAEQIDLLGRSFGLILLEERARLGRGEVRPGHP